MRKSTAIVLALVVMGGVVVGCGVPMGKSVNDKIQTHSQQLDSKNYESEATMTVQMDNNVQTYYVKVSYESPEIYQIALGNKDKQIHQIIVHNQNGMFIVSPSLGKVFRFNGDWAQNQGQIYLYDQLLKQVSSKDAKLTKGSGQYTFTVPVTPSSDSISKQKIVLDSKTLNPKSVELLDKDGKSAVTLTYQSFKTGVKFDSEDFNPQSLVNDKDAAKTTMTGSDKTFGYVEPSPLFGTKMLNFTQPTETSAILKFGGDHHYLLQEFRPTQSKLEEPTGELVDMFGTPAMYTGSSEVNSLTWLDNGVEFELTSSDMNIDQLQAVAESTLGQVGK